MKNYKFSFKAEEIVVSSMLTRESAISAYVEIAKVGVPTYVINGNELVAVHGGKRDIDPAPISFIPKGMVGVQVLGNRVLIPVSDSWDRFALSYACLKAGLPVFVKDENNRVAFKGNLDKVVAKKGEPIKTASASAAIDTVPAGSPDRDAAGQDAAAEVAKEIGLYNGPTDLGQTTVEESSVEAIGHKFIIMNGNGEIMARRSDPVKAIEFYRDHDEAVMIRFDKEDLDLSRDWVCETVDGKCVSVHYENIHSDWYLDRPYREGELAVDTGKILLKNQSNSDSLTVDGKEVDISKSFVLVGFHYQLFQNGKEFIYHGEPASIKFWNQDGYYFDHSETSTYMNIYRADGRLMNVRSFCLRDY